MAKLLQCRAAIEYIDVSRRYGGKLETVSVSRVVRQGYRVDDVRQTLLAKSKDFDGFTYRGEGWAVAIIQ